VSVEWLGAITTLLEVVVAIEYRCCKDSRSILQLAFCTFIVVYNTILKLYASKVVYTSFHLTRA
jgi:hypothetical protein